MGWKEKKVKKTIDGFKDYARFALLAEKTTTKKTKKKMKKVYIIKTMSGAVLGMGGYTIQAFARRFDSQEKAQAIANLLPYAATVIQIEVSNNARVSN